MTDVRIPDDAWDDSRDNSWVDLEALIRAAGGYVRASDDLRPRVLEEAHRQAGSQHLVHGLRRLALVVLVASLLTTLLRPPAAPAGLEVRQHVGAGPWSDVEAFTGARRRQAELLRPSAASVARPGA